MTQFFTQVPGGALYDAEEGCLLLGDTTPDVVRLPPQLGGQVVRVIHADKAPCLCGQGSATHYALEGEISVCECTHTHQFLWYRVTTQP